ncbi:MAG: Rrf2 family transcriptional regulator [bacterium]|nr:Rrf2 family transcriptional regulator [bacterium]
MLKFSKKTDYSIQAMIHIAHCPSDEPVSVKEIASAHDIPLELTAKLLQQLVRHGLCLSRQGARGGYLLARPPERITLGEIVEAIEGPLVLDPTDNVPARAVKCDFCRPLTMVQQELFRFLGGISLARLIAGSLTDDNEGDSS